MARPALAFISEQEFLELPESVDKIELIEGEVIVPPNPSFYHQEIVGRLAFELRSWASKESRAVTVGQAPMDVRFAPGRILQPDLFVLSAKIPLDHEGPLDRVPELCVEVLSARPNYDRFTKRLIYAEAGVREFWTIEPGYYVERWTGDGLHELMKLDSIVQSELLPGFTLELSSLFRD